LAYSLAAICLVACAAGFAVDGARYARFAISVLLVLAPVLPIMFCTTLWLQFVRSRSALRDPVLQQSEATSPARDVRIVWIIFDEMDQELAFERRLPSLDLPEFDRFRRQSIYATAAYPPGHSTGVSIPALTTGRIVARATPLDARHLEIRFADTGETALWNETPTIFSRFRSAGLKSALMGWYHPYCRVFGDDLLRCEWFPSIDATDSLRHEVWVDRLTSGKGWRFSLGLFKMLLPGASVHDQYEMVQEQTARQYTEAVGTARQMLSDRSVNLVFLHWMIPHPPGIYDRRTGQLGSGANRGYFDNLALADRTLAQMRQDMGSSLWDRTCVLISADHQFRTALWHGRPLWTDEQEREIGNRTTQRIPFLVKMPGQRDGLVFRPELNTVLTSNLLLAIANGEVASPEQAMNWLGKHAPAPLTPRTPAQ
jgi:hypothetical protein